MPREQKEINYRLVGKRRSNRASTRATLPINLDLSSNQTDFGYLKELSRNKKYSIRVEALAPGNNRGFGFNKKECRTIYVLAGTLYIRYETKEGNSEETTITDNASFTAEAGVKYSYGSGNTAVTLIIVESGNYLSGWEEILPPEYNMDISIEDSFRQAETRSTNNIPPRRERSLAKLQAEQMAKERALADGTAVSHKVVNPWDALNSKDVSFGSARPRGPGAFNE
jgi:mannose-6-phosphate isomerase-like protein (cupin superfamily)